MFGIVAMFSFLVEDDGVVSDDEVVEVEK